MKNVLSIIVILSITSLAICQSDSKILSTNENIEHNLNRNKIYYDEVYLPKVINENNKINIHENYQGYAFNLIRKSYRDQTGNTLTKADSILLKREIDQIYIFDRINILEYDKFIELGVDIFLDVLDSSRREKYNFADMSIWYFNALLILKAKVVDKRLFINDQGHRNHEYSVNYKFVIEETIKGEYLSIDIPDSFFCSSVYAYSDSGRYEIIRHNQNDNILQNGSDLLLFISDRSMLGFINQIRENKIFNLDHRAFSNWDIISSDELLSDYRNKLFESFDQLIAFFRKMELINDTKNFYHRSYK